MNLPRFGQLYIASPQAGRQLSDHYFNSGSTFEKASGTLLREMTGDETVPNQYNLDLQATPVIQTPLPDGRMLIATNKGYPDKDEFLKLQDDILRDRLAISQNRAAALGAHEAAEVYLLNRMDAGADITYIGYDEII